MSGEPLWPRVQEAEINGGSGSYTVIPAYPQLQSSTPTSIVHVEPGSSAFVQPSSLTAVHQEERGVSLDEVVFEAKALLADKERAMAQGSTWLPRCCTGPCALLTSALETLVPSGGLTASIFELLAATRTMNE